MRALFDIQHPAQVHLFRPTIEALEADGHQTLVASREKEVTVELLDAFGIRHVTLSRRRDGLPAGVLELLAREARLLRLARRFRPDVVLGRLTPPAVHVSRLIGCPNVVLHDTDIGSGALARVYYATTLPFVDLLCLSPGFDLDYEGATRTLPFQELAYLHPRRFEPSRTALEAYGVAVDEPYFVVRLAGWDAYHDRGHHGLSPAASTRLVEALSERGTVYVSSERPPPPSLAAYPLPVPPHRIHDLLAFAELYVGDSGTMSSEAAVLGTPAVRVNTMVGPDDEHVFRELEHTYGLLRSFADEEQALACAVDLADDPTAGERWAARRTRFLAEQQDVTAVVLDAVFEEVARARVQTSVRAPALSW